MSSNADIPLSRRSWLDWPGWPYVLVGLAVLLRLAHIWYSRSNPTFWSPAVDPKWYDDAAMNITRGQWGPFPFFRAPVYPMLLAAVYSIFGHDLVAARVLNVILQGATVWIIWHVGRSYFSQAIGVIAATLFALNGMAIFFACELVSPSTEMLMSVLCAWATFRLHRDSSISAIIICGLAYGLAAITRPNFLFVFPVALITLWLVNSSGKLWNSDKAKQALTSSVIWVAAAFLPIVPITAANVIKGGEFVLIATQGGVNFWIGNNPESSGGLAILPGYGNAWEIEDAETDAERDLGHKVTQGELSNYYFNKGLHFMREQPLLATRLMIRKAALFFNQFEISNNKDIHYFSALTPWLPWLRRLNFGFLVPLAALGMLVMWRQPMLRILVALSLLYAASVILFFMTARFRMPVVPWLAWISAGGVAWIFNAIRNRFSARRLVPLLILIPAVTLAFIDVWQLRDPPVGWARFMEGNAFMHLQQNDSARIAYLDAIRDHQEVTRAYLNLGVLAFREQKLPEAQHWYEQSIISDSMHWKSWNNYGIVLEAQGDTTSALLAYRRALTIDSVAGDARENLAGTYFRLGVKALKMNLDSLAIAYLDSSVALHPDPAAFYNRALAFIRFGANQQAEQDLNTALALDPDLKQVSRLRAYLRSGVPPTGDSLR